MQGVDGVQRFSIHKDYGVMDRLPQAHTCFNQSKLENIKVVYLR
jgi:E3 ubiquitin-protein ligase HUWE1